uniref:SFRICE_000914 n=1 Tax=Spodoptera frugiperda TaxID=7108 RepID=A0A2H1VBZ4_SPOFR
MELYYFQVRDSITSSVRIRSDVSQATAPSIGATYNTTLIKVYAHVVIADDAVRTMRISGRSCMSFYTRQTKIRCVRCVRCGPVDAYL